MISDICGTADIGRNLQSVVLRKEIKLDVSNYYGYTLSGLLKLVPGEILYYKIHPANWISFENKYLWRFANILNNIARHLRIFHNLNYMSSQIQKSLDFHQNTYIGLHDWLTTKYISEAELLLFLRNEFGEELHRLLICETQFGGYINANNYVNQGRFDYIAHFGRDRQLTKNSKRIISFKRYMEKLGDEYNGC